MIKAGLIGATGYTGIETLRLLLMHTQVHVHVATSRTDEGKSVSEIFPGFRANSDLVFSGPDSNILSECDVIFFATPNTVAMKQVPDLLDAGIRIIDLSADFRLKNADEWSECYGQKHSAPELLSQAVYGLPEINRDKIKEANLVANPGCYPTAIILGLLPGLESQVFEINNIIADAKSGVSGAGRKAQKSTQYCEVSESFKAYAASGHRHLPEIVQILNTISQKEINMTFVPHLVPMKRGIHATIYAQIKNNTDLYELYVTRFKDEPFVDILPEGEHPDTSSVSGTNFCRIALHRQKQGNNMIVLSVIDNLVKGAAGQAIQNMNIMFSLDEKTGLNNLPLLT